jgi:hypothetical protein
MRHDYNEPSDRQVILGPIFKYAAIGITIGVVMLTGIVTLERENNTLDQDLANLKAQLADENKQAQESTTTVRGQQTSIQTDDTITVAPTQAESISSEPVVKKAVVTDGPVIEDPNTPTVVEAAPPGDTQTTATLSREVETPVAIEQPVAFVQEPADALPVDPAAATNPPTAIQQPDVVDTRELAEIHDPGDEWMMTAPDMESFDFDGPERLSHREWVEQQRLRHELWLEKVEKRRLEKFGTRKASQPDYYINMPYEKRESM